MRRTQRTKLLQLNRSFGASLLSPHTLSACYDLCRSEQFEQAEQRIEQLLYVRDFDAAFKAIAWLANEYWKEGQYGV